jgi:hypothetical protein
MYKKLYKQLACSDLFRQMVFRNRNDFQPSVYFIEIDPKSIANICRIPEDSPLLRGKKAMYGIKGGVWDLIKRPYKDHYLYKTVGSILRGENYKKTLLYQKVTKGSLTEKEAIHLFKKIDNLIEVLSKESYKSQYELNRFDEKLRFGNMKFPFHEMIVGMDRNGTLMRLVGGKHRLAVAQQVGVQKMYAILSLIHVHAADKLPEKRRIITGKDEDFKPF